MKPNMKLVVDSAIPFIKGVFEPYFNVEYYKGSEFTRQIIEDADALVVRTRTKCNSSLLDGSKVKFIATATIGEDHIDKEYCAANGITVRNAAGCNAGGVLQYVFTALYSLSALKGFSLPPFLPDKELVLGVIGVGNVGSKVADFAERFGFEVLKNDPHKMEDMVKCRGRVKEGYVQLDELLERADIVTLHTSLNPTSKGLASSAFFKKMKKGAIFVNASRGEVTDEEALAAYSDKLGGIIIDVWNNEPNISLKTLSIADVHTPHIAGYSLEGKINGTTMSVHNVADYFGIDELKNFAVDESQFIPAKVIEFGKIIKMKDCREAGKIIAQKLLESYDIKSDSAALGKNPADFELLRNSYNYRREFVAEW